MRTHPLAVAAAVLLMAVLACAALAAGPAEPFVVGVKVHWTWGRGPLDECLSLVRRGGMNGVYDDAYWYSVESAPGKYAMPGSWDQITDKCLAAGVEPVWVLCYWSPHYQPIFPVTDDTREAFARYCEFVVGHWKGKVRKYEVWNEWGGYLGGIPPETPCEGQTIENYVKLIEKVYPRIKAVDPDCTVVGGWTVEGFLDGLIQHKALKYLDAVSVHAYPYNAGSQRYSPEGWIEWIRLADTKLAQASPDRAIPFYVTETGWPTQLLADGTPPEEVLAYAARMYLLARSIPRLRGIYWYDFQNDGLDPKNTENNFGLVGVDLMPKPAWYALRDVGELVSRGQYLGRVELDDPEVYLVRYKHPDGRDVWAVWSTHRDDQWRVTLESDRPDRPAVQLQKVGTAPLERHWGSIGWPDSPDPFNPRQLHVTVGQTPWLVSGDLSGVSVARTVLKRSFPERQRPGSAKLHLPALVVAAVPRGAEERAATIPIPAPAPAGQGPGASAAPAGEFHVSWDARNLYLTLAVQDATHCPDSADALLWRGDSIQLSVQTLRPDEPLPREYTELTAALTERGPRVYRHSSQVGKPIGLADDVPADIRRQDGKTVYRLTVPAAALGLEAFREGQFLGLSLLINRNDGAGRSWVEWGGGIAADKNPARFPWVVLAP